MDWFLVTLVTGSFCSAAFAAGRASMAAEVNREKEALLKAARNPRSYNVMQGLPNLTDGIAPYLKDRPRQPER